MSWVHFVGQVVLCSVGVVLIFLLLRSLIKSQHEICLLAQHIRGQYDSLPLTRLKERIRFPTTFTGRNRFMIITIAACVEQQAVVSTMDRD